MVGSRATGDIGDGRRARLTVRTTLAALIGIVAFAPSAAGQCLRGADPANTSCVDPAPRWAGEAATLGINVLVGGLTAGVIQHLRGGDFADGFTRGALGGGLVYAGKRVAAERFWGAGLMGRQVAAVGASVTRNAAFARPSLETVVLPLGPLRAVVTRAGSGATLAGTGTGAGFSVAVGGLRIRPKLDAAAAAWIAYGIAEPELSFDAGESLSAGTPVFRTSGTVMKLSGGTLAAGLTKSGVVMLSDVPAFGRTFAQRALRHERVHVIQQDQVFTIWTDPLEDWFASKLGAERLNGWADANLSTELLELLGNLIEDHGDRPWELEAIFLARG